MPAANSTFATSATETATRSSPNAELLRFLASGCLIPLAKRTRDHLTTAKQTQARTSKWRLSHRRRVLSPSRQDPIRLATCTEEICHLGPDMLARLSARL